MLPTVNADTTKIIRYAGEVGGRILGLAAMENLIPDANRRAELSKSGQAIISSAQALRTAFVTRFQFEDLDHRITFGKGKGIDRGFEAVVATISENTRTLLPDRNTNNPDYRAIFPRGTDEFMSPTIREDALVANDLRAAIDASNVPSKTNSIALLDSVIPVLEPAAKALADGEKQINSLFQNEINARKTVVDTLWEQRKIVETIFGRAGKTIARFAFFDFRKSNDPESSTPADPAPNPPGEGG